MSDGDKKVSKNNEERKRDVGKALLKGVCLPVRVPSGQVLLYEILDQGTREVRLLSSEAPLEQAVSLGYDSLPDHLKLSKLESSSVAVPFGQEGSKNVKTMLPSVVTTLSVRQVKDVVERYVTEQHEERDVASFAWKDDKRYTLKRITFDVTSGDTPAWDQWCSRLTDAPAFKAWVWSIFEPKHVGRQGLWLKGEEGQDGKSSVMHCVRGIIGQHASAVLDGSERDNRFVHSNLFDKRLLLYPDCKQPSFVKGQIYRNYTGGDDVSVEFKGMQPFSKKVYARIMIAANYSPTIDDEGADKSRLLVIGVSPTTKEQRQDVTWAAKLKEEVPQFLHQCREAYSKLCPSHYSIESTDPELHDQLLSESTSVSEGRWESLFERWFQLEPGGVMPRSDLFDTLRAERINNVEIGSFKRYMKRRGITEVQLSRAEGLKKVYRGVIRRDAAEREDVARATSFVEASMRRSSGGRGRA